MAFSEYMNFKSWENGKDECQRQMKTPWGQKFVRRTKIVTNHQSVGTKTSEYQRSLNRIRKVEGDLVTLVMDWRDPASMKPIWIFAHEYIFIYLIFGCLTTIGSMQNTIRWRLDHCQMALRSVPASHLLEYLVKQKWVVTSQARGRQLMKFVV